MFLRSLVVGPLQTNCYIVADPQTKEAIVIDPGDEPDRIIDTIREEELKVIYLLCTHSHFDHVGALPELKEASGAEVVLHPDELEIYEAARDMAAFWGYEIDPLPPPDLLVRDGDEIKVGSLRFQVLHTPGHSPGGICLFGNGIAFTGDTIFAGSVGRTDFHGGDIEKLKQSFLRILSLPPETEILPGHGPPTTVEREKSENLFATEF